MATTFTLDSTTVFPPGTSVAAYPTSNWPGNRVDTTAAPLGSATNSQTMGTSNLTFTGLAAETDYVAYAQVGGVHRYVGFTLKSLSAGGAIDLTALNTSISTSGTRITADTGGTPVEVGLTSSGNSGLKIGSVLLYAQSGVLRTPSGFVSDDTSTFSNGIAAANTVPTQAGTWQPVAATSGTDTACTNGTAYVGSIFLPNNKTLTGIQYLIGSVGGTTKVIVSLHNYATGAVLKNSAVAGTVVGTAATAQQVPFTGGTYTAIGPAHYWIGLTFDSATAKFRTVPAHCQVGSGVLGNGVTQTFGTPATFTPPTTFTADKVPVASVY